MMRVLLLLSCVWALHGLLTSVDPGICDTTVKQTAGYYNIDTSTDKNYFYWAFESRGDPTKDPIVLWMTGGPGCSSELALFGENGPCTVEADGSTTKNNPYSWNSHANLIYIDQPAGVGFSFSDPNGHDHNEKQVAEDMYAFLQDLFKANPHWQTDRFFLFGESYGGHYVPATAHRVWQGNNAGGGVHIPLKGVGVGNGLTDPEIQYSYYGQLAYNYSIQKLGHPVVSLQAYEQMQAAIPKCIKLIKQCQTSATGLSCVEAQSFCNNAEIGPYEQTGLNPYDIREKCKVPPLCYDFGPVSKYLNSGEIQQKLNVSKKWESCNFQVNGQFSKDWMKNYQQDIPDLLGDKIPVLIYAGDVDFICNWLGNHAWAEALPWPGKSAFNAAKFTQWPASGTAAGEYKTAQGFTFMRIYNAGHMVPLDQPKAALDMLDQFMNTGFN